MDSYIYLDNNATTKCDEEVLHAMLPYFCEQYGNPSSAYSFGKEIKAELIKARQSVAKLFGAEEDEIMFTSCATESNVTAIMNALKIAPDKKHIITTQVEHASIMVTMKYLEKIGYSVTFLPVDTFGRISLEELEAAITEDTCLICVMMANNEIGNIYPIKEIGKIAKAHGIYFHSDCVQAVGKVKVDVKELNVDSISMSGHKINAPKGVGALYIKCGNIFPLLFGHQEDGKRGGTENVPYIIGLGKAAELILNDRYESALKIRQLRDYLENEVKAKISDVRIYGDMDNRIPNTSSMAFKGVDAGKILFALEAENIFVSTGSACNSYIASPSHVLTAIGADLANYSPIRISLGKDNTKEEIDEFIKKLVNIVKEN